MSPGGKQEDSVTEQQITSRFPQFYLTVPTPCPYLPGRMERKIFTQLHGRMAVALNDALTHAGFRRSQNIAYKPACEGCNACLSVRIRARDFHLTRSFRRVRNKNGDVVATVVPSIATEEQFNILRAYLDARHADGGMAGMTFLDYASMVEETAVRSHLVEYRLVRCGSGDGALLAVALTDVLADGLSMVYSFFDPTIRGRSLGSYMILDHIRQTRALDLPYLYLGYWVEQSEKMDYKSRFRPLEVLGPKGWGPLRAGRKSPPPE